jgi:hypothetical protein
MPRERGQLALTLIVSWLDLVNNFILNFGLVFYQSNFSN